MKKAVFMWGDILGYAETAQKVVSGRLRDAMVEFYDLCFKDVTCYKPEVIFAGVNKLVNDGVFAIWLDLTATGMYSIPNGRRCKLSKVLLWRAICTAAKLIVDYSTYLEAQQGLAPNDANKIKNFGIGVCLGEASLGLVGKEGSLWSDYFPIGHDVNRAILIGESAGKSKRGRGHDPENKYSRLLVDKDSLDELELSEGAEKYWEKDTVETIRGVQSELQQVCGLIVADFSEIKCAIECKSICKGVGIECHFPD